MYVLPYRYKTAPVKEHAEDAGYASRELVAHQTFASIVCEELEEEEEVGCIVEHESNLALHLLGFRV